MPVILEWDDGNWPKCGEHGLPKDEIEAFFAMDPTVRPDPSVAEPRLRAIGRGASGRYLFVVFTLRRREGITYIRPISARHMHSKEVSRYEQDSSEAASLLRH